MAMILRVSCRGKNVFENGVQRMLFGTKIKEVTGHSRRQHNDKLYLYFSPNNIRRIKSGKTRLSGKGTRVVGRVITYRILMD